MTAFAGVFYPVNAQYYRLEGLGQPERMFQRSVFDSTFLSGEGEWEGRLYGRSALLTPDNLKEKSKGVFYTFQDGVLASTCVNGKSTPVTTEFRCAEATLYPTEKSIRDLVDEAARHTLWDGTSRLRFLAANPNVTGAFLVGLCLVLLGSLIGTHPCRTRLVLTLLVAMVLAGGVLRTESRSSFLALMGGLVALFALSLNLRGLKKKSVWMGLGLGLVVVLAAVFCFGTRFSTALLQADELRVDIFRNLPAMIAESPEGVGLGHAGMVYDVWYRDSEIHQFVRTLIGSHQTLLVEFSWWFRGAYVFAWLLLLALSACVGVRRGNCVTFAVWASFGFCGVFNPIFESPVVWVIPVFCLIWTSFRCGKVLTRRMVSWGASFALIVALAACMACGHYGKKHGHRFAFRVSPKAVFVNGDNPATWIVTDEFALGGWSYLGQEILPFYEEERDYSPVALVEDVNNLPREVDRLVLAGQSVERFLEARRQAQSNGRPFCRAKSVLLISPSCAIQALPADFLGESRFRAVIGSLALHYYEKDGMGKLPNWVRIVPGAREYVPGWFPLSVSF